MVRPFVLAAALALALPALVAPSDARPRQQAAAPGVTVDVSRLRALGLGPTADLLQAALADELVRSGGPAGGRLVVRITGLSLNAYAGSNGDGGGGGGGGSGGGSGTNFDYLEGEILVVGPGGEVVSRRPQVSALNASSGGAYFLPDAERNRVVALAQHFAGWVKRIGV